MDEFFKTRMGQRFYESTLPKIAGELARLNRNLEALKDLLTCELATPDTDQVEGSNRDIKQDKSVSVTTDVQVLPVENGRFTMTHESKPIVRGVRRMSKSVKRHRAKRATPDEIRDAIGITAEDRKAVGRVMRGSSGIFNSKTKTAKRKATRRKASKR